MEGRKRWVRGIQGVCVSKQGCVRCPPLAQPLGRKQDQGHAELCPQVWPGHGRRAAAAGAGAGQGSRVPALGLPTLRGQGAGGALPAALGLHEVSVLVGRDPWRGAWEEPGITFLCWDLPGKGSARLGAGTGETEARCGARVPRGGRGLVPFMPGLILTSLLPVRNCLGSQDPYCGWTPEGSCVFLEPSPR